MSNPGLPAVPLPGVSSSGFKLCKGKDLASMLAFLASRFYFFALCVETSTSTSTFLPGQSTQPLLPRPV